MAKTMEEFTLECPICLEESSVDNFYQITYGVDGQEPIRSVIVEEGCKDCLLAEDVKVYFGVQKRLFDYEIKNQTEYIKKKQKNWLKKVFDLNFDDILSNAEAVEIVNDSGVNSIQNGLEKDKHKALRKNLKFKELLGLIPGPLKLPATLTGTSSQFFHLKSTIEKYVRLGKKGKYLTSSTHKIPLQRLTELAEKDYVAFNQDGKAYFLANTEEGNTVCRKCGEIKLFDKFRYQNKQMTFSCLECESKKQKNRFSSLSPEEYKKTLEGVKAWRKANRDKVREYKKTPEARTYRNVRNRLKKFLKTAKDHHFSQGVGCTRKELVKHLESQFTEGMSWETYGSGENGDHIGSWHIDHIKPISKFEGKHPNHYTNLQPMWGMENIKKSNS
jgi:hypothetical protein